MLDKKKTDAFEVDCLECNPDKMTLDGHSP